MLPESVVSLFVVGDKLEEPLFKCALLYAEHGFNVWFISPQPFSKFPQGINTLDKEILKLITFLYLKEESDLLLHLNSVHLWHKYPQVIIVDSFEEYCSENDIVNAFVMSSVLDASASCARRSRSKKSYVLVNSSKSYTNLVDMYFPRSLTFTSEEDLIYVLKNDVNEISIS
ncbi:hypothetical protein FQR65_LT02178 [Abscondita terminalis]|nr:hypothetical protein FQR65_LT02178 [Abscondita terminalis]